MQTKISIIIVTYNSYDLILDCINSIFRYNDLDENEIEIIVVDNSSDFESERLKNLLFTEFKNKVKFIKNENKGYGHGNNVGAKISKGEIIAVMNPDIRLSEPVFKRTLEIFEDHQTASLGFKQIDGNRNFSFYRLPELFFPLSSSIKTRNENNTDKFNPNIHYLSGAFVFFRKKDFEEIGMYDENFYMYFEEADITRRINRINKKSVYDCSKSYIHLMEQKDDFNERLLGIGTESIKIYFDKYDLNVKKYIKLRLAELRIHQILFSILGNRGGKARAKAYIKSLRKLL